MAWVAIANWPGTARGPAWAIGVPTAGGKVYTGGGDDGLGIATAACHVYNPATDSWSAIASMNQARTKHAAAVYFAGNIYVFGGESPAGTMLNSVEVYNIAANTWTTKTSMPGTPDDRLGACRYGANIYVFQGNAAGTSVLRYNMTTDSWTTLSGFSATPGADWQAVLLNDVIYIIGDTRVIRWDPVNETYLSLFTPSPPFGANPPYGWAVLGTNLYAWGGPGGSDVYTITPANETPPTNNWVGLGESAPDDVDAGGSSMLPWNGDTLFLLPERGDTTKNAYKLGITVPTEGAATVLDDIGEFRYNPRWPDLQKRWGGTNEEWDKVMAAFDYDESTGSFRKKG